jgi:transposase
MIRELQAAVSSLQEQVRTLTERQQRNSDNSSRPPSSDPPWRQREKRPPSGRKRGGQRGHPGACRQLAPPSAVDHVVVVVPPTCEHCGETFPTELPHRKKLRRHQVVELPPLRPEITEYQLHARRCRCCRRRTWAQLPAGVSRRCVGPRAQAIAGLLTGACHLSRRTAQSLLHDVFGMSLSLGTLSAVEADLARALAAPYAEVAAAIPHEPVVGVDETSWREAGTLHWLWTAVTPRFAFYRLDRHRSRAAFTALVDGGTAPEAASTAPTEPLFLADRYCVYDHLPPERRSFCWAHLARDFRAAYERGGTDGAVGSWALDVLGKVLEPWRRYRQGELSREAARTAVRACEEQLRSALNLGSAHGARATRTLCDDLLCRWDSLWSWLDTEGGEPTNNAAERALRPAVLWRKSSFGHQSETGEQFVERMLTAVTSLRLQGRNIWDYLVQACEAAAHGQPAPSLLIKAPP